MTGVSEALALALYVAAARTVATTGQVLRLRATIVPAMDRYRLLDLNEEEVMSLVDEAMGGPWELPEVFAEHLEALGFTRGGTGK